MRTKLAIKDIPQSVNIALYSPDDYHVIIWSPIDVRGNFLFEGLPAGSYWIGASAYSTEVKHMISVRRQFTVGDGATSEITLPLDLPSEPVGEPPKRNLDIP